jgi:hypothetical protein
MGENICYLHFEIGCDPVAVRHVQMLKRAAASFVLSLFCLLMAIQLPTSAVLSYLRMVLNPSYLHTPIEVSVELCAKRIE